MAQLDEKVVIITGGARGLGRAYAVRAAGQGARVIVGDVRDTTDTVDEIKAAGGEVSDEMLQAFKQEVVTSMYQATDNVGMMDEDPDYI